MNCPKCNSKTDLVDHCKIKSSVRRRRECRECFHRFTTYEVPAESYKVAEIAKAIRSDMERVIAILDQDGEAA